MIQSGGVFEARLGIGGLVKSGDVIGWVGQTPVLATTAGIVRGLIHAGVSVQAQLKIGDVDPRGVLEHCCTISDKALAIGGGVLEAVLIHLRGMR